ncbi:MAG: hypothetical protein IPK50_07835 [Fibrobacterota bacterium]|nr:MAG: hypothetical protein IPK50_07835 [Fibrobacterota bacterium]
MEILPHRKIGGKLMVSKYLQGDSDREVSWSDIESIFRGQPSKKRDFMASFYTSEDSHGRYTLLASLRLMWAGDQYLLLYCDFTEHYDDCFAPSSPDQGAVGKIEVNVEDWDASCFRKDIEFVEHFFKQFVELGWIDVDEFMDPDWKPK